MQVYHGLKYTVFLVLGLVMKSVLKNAFANYSWFLIQFNIMDNIVYREMFSTYMLVAAVRGLVVGAGVFLFTAWFADMSFFATWWIVIFAELDAALLDTMGLIAGIFAEKLDQLAFF